MLSRIFFLALVLSISFNASAKLIDHSIVLASNTEKRLSVDAVEPAKVCERFLNDAQKARCISEMKRPFADSYLTSICDRQFDDDAFFKCLGLAEQYHFDPRKIQPCAGDLEDNERLSCLQTAGRPWKTPTRDAEPPSARFPASSHKVKKKGAKSPRAHITKHVTKKKKKSH